MGLWALFRRARTPQEKAGSSLYEAVVAQSRQPAFYRDLGAPDTLEGRFEVYALHLSLIVLRLRGEGAEAEAVSQSLFDQFIDGLEDGLRNMGVGDTGVAKRMKKLGQAVYGRLHGYDEAFAALPDRSALAALLARTVHAPEGEAPAAPAPPAAAGVLADYVVEAREALRSQPLDSIKEGIVRWPPVTT